MHAGDVKSSEYFIVTLKWTTKLLRIKLYMQFVLSHETMLQRKGKNKSNKAIIDFQICIMIS